MRRLVDSVVRPVILTAFALLTAGCDHLPGGGTGPDEPRLIRSTDTGRDTVDLLDAASLGSGVALASRHSEAWIVDGEASSEQQVGRRRRASAIDTARQRIYFRHTSGVEGPPGIWSETLEGDDRIGPFGHDPLIAGPCFDESGDLTLLELGERQTYRRTYDPGSARLLHSEGLAIRIVAFAHSSDAATVIGREYSDGGLGREIVVITGTTTRRFDYSGDLLLERLVHGGRHWVIWPSGERALFEGYSGWHALDLTTGEVTDSVPDLADAFPGVEDATATADAMYLLSDTAWARIDDAGISVHPLDPGDGLAAGFVPAMGEHPWIQVISSHAEIGLGTLGRDGRVSDVAWTRVGWHTRNVALHPDGSRVAFIEFAPHGATLLRTVDDRGRETSLPLDGTTLDLVWTTAGLLALQDGVHLIDPDGVDPPRWVLDTEWFSRLLPGRTPDRVAIATVTGDGEPWTVTKVEVATGRVVDEIEVAGEVLGVVRARASLGTGLEVLVRTGTGYAVVGGETSRAWSHDDLERARPVCFVPGTNLLLGLRGPEILAFSR